MPERTWEGFLAFLYELPSRLRLGRQQIRVVRDNLEALVTAKIRPRLTTADEAQLFPLGFSPAESDLKIAAGVGMERGLITALEYEQAVRADKIAGPFGFLQTMSGKTFGESVAPLIARYWLVDEGDSYEKLATKGLYDVRWTPVELGKSIRIELKTSSENRPRFQQIRDPWMIDPDSVSPDYDILLCLRVSNQGLE